MSLFKPWLSFLQIIKMNSRVFFIRYSFGPHQSAVNQIYDFTGAKTSQKERNILLINFPLRGLGGES